MKLMQFEMGSISYHIYLFSYKNWPESENLDCFWLMQDKVLLFRTKGWDAEQGGGTFDMMMMMTFLVLAETTTSPLLYR
jgi:hypothetical protein